MFIIQCPIVWYEKLCALPSARSSHFMYHCFLLMWLNKWHFLWGNLLENGWEPRGVGLKSRLWDEVVGLEKLKSLLAKHLRQTDTEQGVDTDYIHRGTRHRDFKIRQKNSGSWHNLPFQCIIIITFTLTSHNLSKQCNVQLFYKEIQLIWCINKFRLYACSSCGPLGRIIAHPWYRWYIHRIIVYHFFIICIPLSMNFTAYPWTWGRYDQTSWYLWDISPKTSLKLTVPTLLFCNPDESRARGRISFESTLRWEAWRLLRTLCMSNNKRSALFFRLSCCGLRTRMAERLDGGSRDGLGKLSGL